MPKHGGITDKTRNPFANKDWINQGHNITLHRLSQLDSLFGKSLDEIKGLQRNEGSYPAFIGIRWGVAEMIDGKLAKIQVGYDATIAELNSQ